MPINVTCACGAVYNLNDNFAGQTLICEACSAKFIVPAAAAVPPPAAPLAADPVFDRDRFLLREGHLSVTEKYSVLDPLGNELLFVERPKFLLRWVAALLGGFAAAAVHFQLAVIAVVAAVALKLPFLVAPLYWWSYPGSLLALYLVFCALYKRRHITVYRDESRSEVLLHVFQHNKVQFFRSTYVVTTPGREVLAWLEKRLFQSLLLKRWDCSGEDGAPLAVIKEDAVMLSLLRRLPGGFFGLLRTNFIIYAPDEETVLGEFNRTAKLRDRYVLDLTGDPERRIDRRVALAMGVLLDTEEAR